MTVFESKVEINKPVAEVYSFLSDFNNHQRLMPDTVSNWASTQDTASFTVQGMANLALRITNRVPNSTIIISPDQEVPFNVDIRWVVADLGNNTTEAILTFSAELNMMMKMMASGPLQKLANQQTASLKSILQ
ncbi:SRPBCC family protein [Pedobacter sp. SYSU D00535]|uniref:SRPBCC family protein n=1 Tax=Pedobacter sp. SYSU D00535 TaxID=2810308 RepID=UPI001A9778D5|nr:SRPBCC family protein [Pedobacter sp. SYSU D00535]